MGLTSRLANGANFGGGVSTGKTGFDNCGFANVDSPQAARFCNYDLPFADQSQFKLHGLWPLPADFQVSATFQSNPGRPALAANYNVPNAVIAPSLGRSLSGGANATINLVTPATLYGARINQFDIRAAKLLKFGRMRSQFSVDIYNLLNSDATQTYNQTYVLNGPWLTPTLILPARFAKLTVQLDF